LDESQSESESESGDARESEILNFWRSKII
jgi:hypothetical protein